MHKFVDIWDEAIKVSPDIYGREYQEREARFKKFDAGDFQPGVVRSIGERWDGQPHRFFVIKTNGKSFVGSKLLSEIVTKHGSPGFFCSKISKEMILGELEYIQTSQEGVDLFYTEVGKREIETFFDSLRDSSTAEIYYPFVQLVGTDKAEIHTPDNGWHIDENRAFLLGMGEIHLRALSARFMRNLDTQNLVVYDPACSTGQFLFELKQAHPDIHTIGQDISADMIRFAEGKADELYVGDSLHPKPAEKSVDLIFFRFLNTEVVSRSKAIILFRSVMRCLKDGGHAVLFGHTPVLLNKAELLNEGCHVRSCIETVDGSVVQFYVIQKENQRERLYLRPDVIVEPLIAQYRASPYLFQPASAAMLLKRLVGKLLKSFADDPQTHVQAVSNPRLKGGPFLTLERDKAESARHLYADLTERLKPLFQVAETFERLGTALADESGASLERYLDDIPVDLAACIELTYDAWNRAHFNINEPMLYRSKYFDRALQSFLIYKGDPDEKDFALSTPRIARPDAFVFQRSFNDDAMRRLFATRSHGIDEAEVLMLSEALGVDLKRTIEFLGLFTNQPPRYGIGAARTDRDEVDYFGHACVLVRSAGLSVLVDPFISYATSKDDSRLTIADLPDTIDAVLITHLHIDHFCIETLLNIRHRVGIILVPSCAGSTLLDPSPFMVLQSLGFESVMELKSFQTFQLNETVSVQALPFQGEHGELNVTSKAMFSISTAHSGYLFVADARFDNTHHLARIAELVNRRVDTVFIGMESKGAPFTWLYGPLMACQTGRKHAETRRLNGSCSRRASELVNAFQPSTVFVYALGREPWLAPIMAVEADGDTKIQDEIDLFIDSCGRLQKRVAVLCGTRHLTEITHA
ncbi:MBL fold metallo-hydrolase [Xenorhabdus khoisanae]|uniref:MBL fold metallo-hydrolase n=1 Tax=Xenorhabdus khoisanae TaxID=880157 RepID=UPI0023587FAB|nr:MBL fold metallo-hydrolase [Xenorhabdus khoisanae]MDC9613630.1 MBL fold metallo-hydrolase [Xenorhabdus khoisanae]